MALARGALSKLLLRAAGTADESINAHCLPGRKRCRSSTSAARNSTPTLCPLCLVGQLGVTELQGQQLGLAVCQAPVGHHDIRSATILLVCIAMYLPRNRGAASKGNGQSEHGHAPLL